MSQQFEINGNTYEEIDRGISKGMKSSLAHYAALAMMSGAYMYGEGRKERTLPDGINIVKEYELIEQKKSKLSKWERDRVVAIFKSRYKQIEP